MSITDEQPVGLICPHHCARCCAWCQPEGVEVCTDEGGEVSMKTTTELAARAGMVAAVQPCMTLWERNGETVYWRCDEIPAIFLVEGRGPFVPLSIGFTDCGDDGSRHVVIDGTIYCPTEKGWGAGRVRRRRQTRT